MGRKELPAEERKKRIWIFVKAKNYAVAAAAAKKLEKKYNAETKAGK